MAAGCRKIAVVLLTCLLCVVGSAIEGAERRPRITDPVDVTGKASSGQRVINGIVSFGFPTVGALLKRDNGLSMHCSGTLVACDRFLTAGHCIARAPDPTQYKVFLQHAGLFSVGSIEWQPDQYRKPMLSGSNADVALIMLGRPVEGISPSEANLVREVFENDIGTLVGFGLAREGSTIDFGLKRYGQVKVAQCKFAKPNDMICWNYIVGSPGASSNTCKGDSGGPLFATVGPRILVAGVTSGGVDAKCGVGDHSYDASVYVHNKWLSSHLKDPRQCDNLPAASDNKAPSYTGWSGTLNAEIERQVFRFRIDDAVRLTATMNATGRFPDSDFNLYVIPGSSDDISQASCVSSNAGQFEACGIEQPESGIWTIVVDRKNGSGQFQATVSAY